MNCCIGHRHVSGLDLVWLWNRSAAVALIRPLAWELPYAAGVALKTKKKKKKKTKPKKQNKTKPCCKHSVYHLFGDNTRWTRAAVPSGLCQVSPMATSQNGRTSVNVLRLCSYARWGWSLNLGHKARLPLGRPSQSSRVTRITWARKTQVSASESSRALVLTHGLNGYGDTFIVFKVALTLSR